MLAYKGKQGRSRVPNISNKIVLMLHHTLYLYSYKSWVF